MTSNRAVTWCSTAVIPLALTMLWVGSAIAHDFWIVPLTFDVEPGGTLEARGQTGTRFPVSEGAVRVDRIAKASVIDASDAERLTDLSVSEKSLVIRHGPVNAGQRVIAVALVPSS